MQEEQSKREVRKEFSASSFILAIVIAVVLSFLVSLIIVNLSEPVVARNSDSDSGTIIVQITPPSNSEGTIQVEVDGDEVN